MGGAELQWLSLLNSALYRGEWPVSRLGRFFLIEKAPQYILEGVWVLQKARF